MTREKKKKLDVNVIQFYKNGTSAAPSPPASDRVVSN
jgi:hypothetical protein